MVLERTTYKIPYQRFFCINNQPHHSVVRRLQNVGIKKKVLYKTISVRVSITNQTQHKSLWYLLFSWWTVKPVQVIISIKFFIQAVFWLLTCVYHIYWMCIHWSWSLSSGVIANCQWAGSKLYIQICFLHRLVEGCSKAASFVFAPIVINTLIVFK